MSLDLFGRDVKELPKPKPKSRTKRKRSKADVTSSQVTKALPIRAENIPVHLYSEEVISPNLRPDPVVQDVPGEITQDGVVVGISIKLQSWEFIQKKGGDIEMSSHRLENGANNIGTVTDARLGPMSEIHKCIKCGRFRCPGHYGLTNFSNPTIPPKNIKFVATILQCICNNCSKCLFTNSFLNKTKHMKNNEFYKFAIKSCKDVMCTGPENCGVNPKIITTEIVDKGIVAYVQDKTTQIYTTRHIYDIFFNITKKDAEKLRFTWRSHPIDLILQGMLVNPTQSRTPYNDGHSIKYKFSTQQQGAIVRAAQGEDPGQLYSAVSLLVCKSKQKKGGGTKEMESVMDSIQGKGKIIRGSVSAKSSDQTMRTVANPGSRILLGEVRYPYAATATQTKKVLVNRDNFAEIFAMQYNNRLTHVTPAGSDYRKTMSPFYRIAVGDVVDRCIRDYDVVNLNRQPTLHGPSMEACQVRISKDMCLGLHIALTTPYNADFDGDELNGFTLHSLKALAEALVLMRPKNMMLSPQSMSTTMGAVLNSVLGLYIMTHKPRKVSQSMIDKVKDSMIIRGNLRWELVKRKYAQMGIDPNTTRGLLTLVLPEGLCYTCGTVSISNGVLTRGHITSSTVGPKCRTLMPYIYRTYGEDRMEMFVTELTRLGEIFLATYGLSMNIMDFCNIATDEEGKPKDMYRAVVEEAYVKMKEKLKKIGPPVKDKGDEKVRQRKVMNALNTIKEIGTNITSEHMDPNTPLYIMSEKGAGVKGNSNKNGQMMGEVGQQYQGKKLLERSMSNNTRNLPFFDFNDPDPKAGGFIHGSYFTGVDPPGLFQIQQAGREGILDTSVSTSVFGDMQRKMTKSMENIITREDMSLRVCDREVLDPLFNSGYHPNAVSYQNEKGIKKAIFLDVKSLVNRLNGERGWVRRKETADFMGENCSLFKNKKENVSASLAECRGVNSYAVGITPLTEEEKNCEYLPLRMTSYEKAKFVGLRAQMLEFCDPPLFKHAEAWDGIDPVSAAMEEATMGLSPKGMLVKRVYPNGDVEYIAPFNKATKYPEEVWFSQYKNRSLSNSTPYGSPDYHLCTEEGHRLVRDLTALGDEDALKEKSKMENALASHKKTVKLQCDEMDRLQKEEHMKNKRNRNAEKEHPLTKVLGGRADGNGPVYTRGYFPSESDRQHRKRKSFRNLGEIGEEEPGSSGTAEPTVQPSPFQIQVVESSEPQKAPDFYETSLKKRKRHSPDLMLIMDAHNYAKRLVLSEAKELLIDEAASGELLALDLGCGKGGDIHKWKYIGVKHLYGIDTSKAMLIEMESRTRTLGPGMEVTTFNKSACDDLEKDLVPKVSICSSMFSLNYLVGSSTNTRNAMHNATKFLKRGGIFVCIFANQDAVRNWTNSNICSVIPITKKEGQTEEYVRRTCKSYRFKLGDKTGEELVDEVEHCIGWKIMMRSMNHLSMKLVYKVHTIPTLLKDLGDKRVNWNWDTYRLSSMYTVCMFRKE